MGGLRHHVHNWIWFRHQHSGVPNCHARGRSTDGWLDHFHCELFRHFLRGNFASGAWRHHPGLSRHHTDRSASWTQRICAGHPHGDCRDIVLACTHSTCAPVIAPHARKFSKSNSFIGEIHRLNFLARFLIYKFTTIMQTDPASVVRYQMAGFSLPEYFAPPFQWRDQGLGQAWRGPRR